MAGWLSSMDNTLDYTCISFAFDLHRLRGVKLVDAIYTTDCCDSEIDTGLDTGSMHFIRGAS